MSKPGLETDVIVLGGGCAGLSLASRMAARPDGPRLLVVESRREYQEDRTWCGWRLGPHFFDDCVVRDWPSWQVTGGERHRQTSDRYPYEMVSAGLFYDKACRAVASSNHVTLLTGADVLEVEERAETVEVRLCDGTVHDARWVIDTRPKRCPLSWPWIWQNFVGLVVEFEKAQSRVLGDIPTLMNFRPEEGHVAQFVYVLPFSATQYLVEWTRLSTKEGQLPAIESQLRAWLDTVSSQWRPIRRECGSLPMAVPEKEPTSRRVVVAGMRGGSMRASSGYAFHAIQRWADDCASSLAAGGPPLPPMRSKLLEALDASFLSVLQKEPGAARELFAALFARCPAEPLVRFLAGHPEVGDYWYVIASLPWRRFLPTVPRAISQWCRA